MHRRACRPKGQNFATRTCFVSLLTCALLPSRNNEINTSSVFCGTFCILDPLSTFALTFRKHHMDRAPIAYVGRGRNQSLLPRRKVTSAIALSLYNLLEHQSRAQRTAVSFDNARKRHRMPFSACTHCSHLGELVSGRSAVHQC